MRIAIIGHGNVATSIHAAFAAKGMSVPMIGARELLAAQADGADKGVGADEGVGANVGVGHELDVLIYAVKDAVLADVVGAVHTASRTLHVHTSGTMPISVFGEDKPHCAILYPFQTFSKAQPISDFSDIPLFIEAKCIDDVSAVYSLALMLSSRVIEASQHDRERLHVAGVFANNFTNCMYAMAAEILKGTTIPFSALLPLIDQTARKVHELSPKQAQTGPAVRRDTNVIDKHLHLIKDEQMQNVYTMLTDCIQRLSEQ